jgi:hypothetical protein
MGLYPDDFWLTYDSEVWREKGRQAARRRQRGENPQGVLRPFADETWGEYLQDLAKDRDKLRRLVHEGNRDMLPNADYLDGFLSMWD